MIYRKEQKMAVGVITLVGRTKLCKAHAGDKTLPPIIEMAIGDGAIEQGIVVETTGEETALYHELLRKPVKITYPEETTARYTVKLEKNELVDAYINEIGLYDSEGSLVAYKSFLQKGKDGDMEFDLNMDEVF